MRISLRQQLSGIFNERIPSLQKVGSSHVNSVRGRDAELGVVTLAIVHRTSREAHHPPIGQLARER